MKKINLLLLMSVVFPAYTHAQHLTLKWSTDTLLRVPESVLLDSKANLLYISNIEGKGDEKDGKGFISKLSTDGKIIALRWASGLNAPKGLGMAHGNLYVADITRVVVFSLTTGKQTQRIEIEGAEFLNDITVDNDGNVFVSDSATGKIHKVDNNKAELYFEDPAFKRINGLLALEDGGLYVVDSGNGKNYKLSRDKKLAQYAVTAQGADGIARVGRNEYIVSSWGGEVYFVNASGASKKLLDTKDQKLNSADIDYDTKTKTLFIPTFNGNCVMAYTFKK